MPYASFNQKDVYGKFLKHFRIKDVDRYCAALEGAAGGKLFSVVVRNERVSKELLQNRCLDYR